MLKFADKENIMQQKNADTANIVQKRELDSNSNAHLYDSFKSNINTIQKKCSSVESSNKNTFYANVNDVMQMKSNSNVIQKVDDFDFWSRSKRIISRALFKRRPDYIYRADGRSLETIRQAGGFMPRDFNSQSTLLEHVQADDIGNSGHNTKRDGKIYTSYVSTASKKAFIRKPTERANFIFGGGALYIYKIKNQNLDVHDVLDHLDKKGFSLNSHERIAAKALRTSSHIKPQREWSIKGGIPYNNIVAYIPKGDFAKAFLETQISNEDDFDTVFNAFAQEVHHDEANEGTVQGKFISSSNDTSSTQVLQKKTDDTGLPDGLKTNIESLSGYSMNDVKVHYNSSKPAQMKALAYTQGTDIHVAPGQEKHLGHEAWHVVQQKQGRVQPTTQMKGVNINDNASLEREADVMGAKATQLKAVNNTATVQKKVDNNEPIQFFRTYYYENAGEVKDSNVNSQNFHIESDAKRAGKKRAYEEYDRNNIDTAKKVQSYNDCFMQIYNNKKIFDNKKDEFATCIFSKKDEFTNLLDIPKEFEITRDKLNTIQYIHYIANRIGRTIYDNWQNQEFLYSGNNVGLIFEILGYADSSLKEVQAALRYFGNFDERVEVQKYYFNREKEQKVFNLGKTDKDMENKNLLNRDENMMIVSHGARPLVGFLRDFAIGSPANLASRIVSIIPDGYTGEIYLDGCHTGEPTALINPKLNDGTSYAECFGKELVKLLKKFKKNAHFTVKGNLGAATTTLEGREKIELDRKSRSLAKQREELINSSIEILQTSGVGKDSLGRRNAIHLSKSQQEEYKKAINICLYNKKTSETASEKIEKSKDKIDDRGRRIDSVAGSATKMIYYFST